MTLEHEKPKWSASLAASWGVTLVAILTALFTLSNSFSRVELTQQTHGSQIDALAKSTAAQQTLSYSTLTQLAQLQQSVADIKASLTRDQK